MIPIQIAEWLPSVRALAAAAGEIVLPYFRAGTAVDQKADGSPVTDADYAAQAFIVAGLRALTPGIPVVCEEREMERPAADTVGDLFWLVDPVDGTREFVAGHPDFTVNIGLAFQGEPVLGVIDAPALGRHFFGARGFGAFRADAGGQPVAITARRRPAAGGVAVVSRSHGNPRSADRCIDRHPGMVRRPMGSSLKFCELAAGSADLYPRFGPTHEWDTAAGHAILLAAGGRVTDGAGGPLRYGKADFLNPDFVATGLSG